MEPEVVAGAGGLSEKGVTAVKDMLEYNLVASQKHMQSQHEAVIRLMYLRCGIADHSAGGIGGIEKRRSIMARSSVLLPRGQIQLFQNAPEKPGGPLLTSAVPSSAMHDNSKGVAHPFGLATPQEAAPEMEREEIASSLEQRHSIRSQNSATSRAIFTQRSQIQSVKGQQETFEVLSMWVKTSTGNHGWGGKQTKAFAGDSRGGDRADVAAKTWYVVHPHNPFRACWDVVSLLLVMYDMIMIPLQYFEPPETDFILAAAWITRIFWTIDMPFSFLTGYITGNGFISMGLRDIAVRYLFSWFGLDMFVVCLDWAEVIVDASSAGGDDMGDTFGVARVSKAGRTFRIIRMLRLLRLARVRHLLVMITEQLQSEKVVVIWDIIKLLFILVSFAHLIACMWYGVATQSPLQLSWVDFYNLRDSSLHLRYATSFHWSITQFAGGMDEFTPENYGERVFAISAFILGFCFAAWFISSLTSSMTKLNIIGSDQTQQLTTLRVYLHQNNISSRLAMRVHRNAQHALAEQQRCLPEESVQLLRLVSEPLYVEIHLEMYAPLMSHHPWFKKYIENCPQVMRKVCHLATLMLSVSQGDVIFAAGEMMPEPKMYIVTTGECEYDMIDGQTVRLAPGTWVAEAVLWTQWIHRGDFVVCCDSRICALDAQMFQRIASLFEHQNQQFDPKDRAAHFCKSLSQMEHPVDVDLEILLADDDKQKHTLVGNLVGHLVGEAVTVPFARNTSGENGSKRQVPPEGPAPDFQVVVPAASAPDSLRVAPDGAGDRS